MNGIINYIKPPGITSNDAVVDFKKLLGTKKVGHAGTLDPAAAGVLPITVGRSTRLFDYLLHSDKVYIGEILLGVATDTYDTCGAVVRKSPVSASAEAIRDAMAALTGDIRQFPPMYSAVKVGGKRLHQLARKGRDVYVAPRGVTVSAFELLDMPAPDRARFRVQCSKGTYVRTLAHDLGAALGCGGCLSLLIRTRSGGFGIEDARTLDQLREAQANGTLSDMLIPPDAPLQRFPALAFPEACEARFRNGMTLPAALASGPAPEGAELVRLYCGAAFLGLARVGREAGETTVKLHCTLT